MAHNRGRRDGAGRRCGGPVGLGSVGMESLLTGGGQHAPDMPRQRQQRAGRDAQQRRLRRQRLFQVGRRTPQQPSTPVRQGDRNEGWSPAAGERQQLQFSTEQRVLRIRYGDA